MARAHVHPRVFAVREARIRRFEGARGAHAETPHDDAPGRLAFGAHEIELARAPVEEIGRALAEQEGEDALRGRLRWREAEAALARGVVRLRRVAAVREAVLARRVAVHVDEERDLAFGDELRDHRAHRADGRGQHDGRALVIPLPIQIEPRQVRAAMAMDHAIRIEHRHHLEDVAAPQRGRRGRVAEQEAEHAPHHPARARLARCTRALSTTYLRRLAEPSSPPSAARLAKSVMVSRSHGTPARYDRASRDSRSGARTPWRSRRRARAAGRRRPRRDLVPGREAVGGSPPRAPSGSGASGRDGAGIGASADAERGEVPLEVRVAVREVYARKHVSPGYGKLISNEAV